MASTYDNDLRLNEMATGDQSGTWGDTTNLNLRLIAEATFSGLCLNLIIPILFM